jgi:hypothetical protein
MTENLHKIGEPLLRDSRLHLPHPACRNFLGRWFMAISSNVAVCFSKLREILDRGEKGKKPLKSLTHQNQEKHMYIFGG